jgi:hypothetical protein
MCMSTSAGMIEGLWMRLWMIKYKGETRTATTKRRLRLGSYHNTLGSKKDEEKATCKKEKAQEVVIVITVIFSYALTASAGGGGRGALLRFPRTSKPRKEPSPNYSI